MTAPKKVLIEVESGDFFKNHDIIGKMDPYVILTLDSQKKQTKICFNEGTRPKWSQKFLFQINKNKTIKFSVWDRDLIWDDHIGDGSLDLDLFDFKSSEPIIAFLPIKAKDQPAGTIKLTVLFMQDSMILSAKNNQQISAENKSELSLEGNLLKGMQESLANRKENKSDYLGFGNLKGKTSGNFAEIYDSNQQSCGYFDPRKNYNDSLYNKSLISPNSEIQNGQFRGEKGEENFLQEEKKEFQFDGLRLSDSHNFIEPVYVAAPLNDKLDKNDTNNLLDGRNLFLRENVIRNLKAENYIQKK